MNRFIILTVLISSLAISAMAERSTVILRHHKYGSGANTEVDRAPMRLPIDVVYDLNHTR